MGKPTVDLNPNDFASDGIDEATYTAGDNVDPSATADAAVDVDPARTLATPDPEVETQTDAGVAGDEALPEVKTETETEAGDGPKAATPESPPEPGPDDAPPPDKKPWKTLRQLNRDYEELQRQREAEAAEKTRLQQELDEIKTWRIQQETLRREQERVAAQQSQQPSQEIPGITRPLTPQERQNFAENDPLGYQQYVIAETQQQFQQLQAAQESKFRELEVRSQINEFRAKTPDYDDALKWLEQDEVKTWRAMGLSDQEVKEGVEFRVSQLVQIARDRGLNVAEVAYRIARERGWSGAAPQPNGHAQPAPVAAQLTPQQRVLESQKRTTLAQASLANIPSGSSPSRIITRADIDQMSEEQIAELDEKSPGWEKNVVE